VPLTGLKGMVIVEVKKRCFLWHDQTSGPDSQQTAFREKQVKRSLVLASKYLINEEKGPPR